MSRRTGAKTPERRAHRAAQIAQRKGHGWRCFYCRRPFTEQRRWTFDHYIPYRLWRTTRLRNLVLACESCNAAKADALPWTVAALLLQRVLHDELWWRACMPATASEYRPAA
ncbi:HNH endonuclease [Streptomyces sp. HK10]|uniref:HNH endonuclease n=1 Tax=Streptomyces sp. HK10 TaxID=3373255 RepID=UPI0037488D4F